MAGLLVVERVRCLPSVRGACRLGNGDGRGAKGAGTCVPLLVITPSGGRRGHHDDDDDDNDKRRRCRSRPDACVRIGSGSAYRGRRPLASRSAAGGRLRARPRGRYSPDLGGDSSFYHSHEATHIHHTHARPHTQIRLLELRPACTGAAAPKRPRRRGHARQAAGQTAVGISAHAGEGSQDRIRRSRRPPRGAQGGGWGRRRSPTCAAGRTRTAGSGCVVNRVGWAVGLACLAEDGRGGKGCVVGLGGASTD